MVFTAITYSDIAISIQRDKDEHVRSILFQEKATAAAGGETTYYVPQNTVDKNAQVWSLLYGKMYRIVSWYVYAATLTGIVSISANWYAVPSGAKVCPISTSSKIAQGETIRLDVISPILSGINHTPPILACVVTSALTVGDILINEIELEVLE